MKLNLYTIAALFITGIGTFLVGITAPELMRMMRSPHANIFNDGFGFVVLFGIGYVLAGIMMLMRLKSSIPLTTFILTSSIVGWIYFFFLEIYNDVGNEKLIVYSMCFFLFIFLIMLTLFVNNDKVIASINEHEMDEDGRDDILDKL